MGARVVGRALALAAALGLVVTGCAGDDRVATSPTSSPTSSLPTYEAVSSEERCGLDVGPVEAFVAEDGSSIPYVEVGDGPVGVVLLHQTTGQGLCGWVSYAGWLAKRDMRVVAIDACGYGRATCSAAMGDDVAGQVRLAVEHLRSEGVRGVALVGASLGGAYALGVADDVKADAVVAVSPPPEWAGVPSVEEAVKAAGAPTTIIAASGDSDIDPPRLRAAVRAADDPQVRYVEVAGDGHGYSLVTDGTIVADPVVSAIGRRVQRAAAAAGG